MRPFLAIFGLLLALALGVGGAHAADMRVTKGDKADSVVVEAQNASLKALVFRLGADFGFKVDWTALGSEDVQITGRFRGPVDTVLRRILKDAGYVIRSTDANAVGIEQVVITQLRSTPAPSVATPAPPPPPGPPHPPRLPTRGGS